MKLQKFDGTGSWESWWAHFQNCASYNKWTKRDKLAFVKGALTGSASQSYGTQIGLSQIP